MTPQDIVKQHINHGKPAHAYLLAGPIVTVPEKEHFVADIVNLLNVPPENLIVIGKNDDAVTIDMMRDIKVMTASSAGNVPRMVTIYNIDALTAQAANAFLKTLEEPPSYTIFFLLASSRAGILPTILSRVWTIRFANPPFNVAPTLNGGLVGLAQTFFQKSRAERYAINEKLAKSDDHGKQFIADLMKELRRHMHEEIKNPALQTGNAIDLLPHAVEAYELLHLPGAPYRLILDTLASYSININSPQTIPTKPNT